jgi:hypothetical protein
VSPLRREASRLAPPSAVTAPLPLQPFQIFAAQAVPAKPPLFPPKSALSSHPATLAARFPALLQRIGLADEAECAVRKSLRGMKFETGSKVPYPQIRRFSWRFLPRQRIFSDFSTIRPLVRGSLAV